MGNPSLRSSSFGMENRDSQLLIRNSHHFIFHVNSLLTVIPSGWRWIGSRGPSRPSANRKKKKREERSRDWTTGDLPRPQASLIVWARCARGCGTVAVAKRRTPGRSCSVSWQKCSVSRQNGFSRLYQSYLPRNYHWKVHGWYYCQLTDCVHELVH